MAAEPSIWQEIRRRKIVQFGLIYAAVGWLMIQIASATFGNLGLPDWAPTLVIVIVAAGFPLVLVLAWAHDTTPKAVPAIKEESVAEPGLVTDLPSIAVLPFENMSDDRENEYLADGMTEDIITGIAKLPGVFVVARNSTFTYKGQNPDIREVGRNLGVRYVLEGSIRPIGDRVRITSQLIETATGGHLWSENYDRPMTELFEVQDEVVSQICNRLGLEMRQAEHSRAKKASPDEMTAWTYVAKAQSIVDFGDKDNVNEAQALLKRALEIDPDYALAMAGLGNLHAVKVINLVSDDAEGDRSTAMELITSARRLAPNDAAVLGHFANALAVLGDNEGAIEAFERARTLAPNTPQIFLEMGFPLIMAGRAQEGIDSIKEGIRRDPVGAPGQGHGMPYFYMGIGYIIQEDFEASVSSMQKSVREFDRFHWAWYLLAFGLVQLDKHDEALDALRRGRALVPEITFEKFETMQRDLSIDDVTTALILDALGPLWDEAGA